MTEKTYEGTYKTIAKVELADFDMNLDLAHEINEFDHISEGEKEDAKKWVEAELKKAIVLFLHTHKGEDLVLFNLLRGVTQIAGLKEQGGGVIYLNGEFGTNFYVPNEVFQGDVSCAGTIHISHNVCPDEEEIENMMEEP
jgi:hypothetical protein